MESCKQAGCGSHTAGLDDSVLNLGIIEIVADPHSPGSIQFPDNGCIQVEPHSVVRAFSACIDA